MSQTKNTCYSFVNYIYLNSSIKNNLTKLKVLIFLGFIIITPKTTAQNHCNLNNNYNDFIQIKILSNNGHNYLTKEFIKINSDSCYSNSINNNITFLNYILANFSSLGNDSILLKQKNDKELKIKYINYLRNDSIFNSLISEYEAKSINKSQAKDSVNFDVVIGIAVKFFSIFDIDQDGSFLGTVCSGRNDLKHTETTRFPFIEAFCFSSLLEHFQSEEYHLYDEFISSMMELYKLSLGINKEDKILRSQGAMYILMRNNNHLRKMLMDTYELKKIHLPFYIKDL